MNKKIFKAGDTLSFQYTGNTGITSKSFTMHLWIDNIQTGSRWKFRYPVINDSCEVDLVISDSLPPGRYALNFLFDDRFFSLVGRVRNYKANAKAGKFNANIINGFGVFPLELAVEPSGRFTFPRTMFDDTSIVTFGFEGKKRADVYIDLVTMLDSSFKPERSYTEIITVGESREESTVTYHFDTSNLTYRNTLPEIIITSKKTNTELFEDEFVTGLFNMGISSYTIDGLQDDRLSKFTSVFQILEAYVPGLSVRGYSFNYQVSWRGKGVSFFVDEVRMPIENLIIYPEDIALIKVYRAPTLIDPLEQGGVIAIYTKRGKYESTVPTRRSVFKVFGYTSGLAYWE
ncbi:MAG TPA: hypothetical protein VLA58_10095 [Chitinophagaceae bacterium]|nr:hypothetical protein [Chitinophagaceae bacterium]